MKNKILNYYYYYHSLYIYSRLNNEYFEFKKPLALDYRYRKRRVHTALPQQPFGHQGVGQVFLLRLRGRSLLVGFPKVVVKALRLRKFGLSSYLVCRRCGGVFVVVVIVFIVNKGSVKEMGSRDRRS
jgi:hypothetical protein